METNLGVGNIGDADKGIETAGNQRNPSPFTLPVLKHPRGDAQEGKQGQGLIGPREVAPQDLEAIGVDFGTQSVRAIVVRCSDGTTISESTFAYPHGVLDRSLPDGTPLPGADWNVVSNVLLLKPSLSNVRPFS